MIIVQSGEIIQFIEQDSRLLASGDSVFHGARRDPRVVQPGQGAGAKSGKKNWLFGHNRRRSHANACSCGSVSLTGPQVR